MPAEALIPLWEATWPKALAAWSPYVQLRAPRFLEHPRNEGEPSMAGQIAAIRMRDLTVLVNTTVIREKRLEHLALPILAHEIGHHVHCPGSLTENARLLGVMVRMLDGLGPDTPATAANLYADLLVNDRLHRRGGIDIVGVYRALREKEATGLWALYTRTYEHLWRLAPGTLAPDTVDATTDGDALLLARMVRAFANDWLRGARRFASVIYPYFLPEAGGGQRSSLSRKGLLDMRDAGQGVIPDGLVAYDPAEDGDDGFEDDFGHVADSSATQDPGTPGTPGGGGQARAPWTYADLLKRLGVDVKPTEVTARYYRERALPHLLPFPSRRAPRAMEPLAEGFETWEAGDALEDLDVLGSLMVSPVPIPGITTVRRVYGETPGSEAARRPIDLDLYVDCSGSMPDPATQMSWLALCGVILALSALRTGGRVQATLWSGAGQTARTAGFVTDEAAILSVVCGYISGGTSFPLPLLRQTWEDRPADAAPAHIVVISDDGVDTMLAQDERGVPGAEIAAMALGKAGGSGTLVLNLSDVTRYGPAPTLRALGWKIHAVTQWEELLTFARAFVRESFADD
jgi:hypothetical protein